MVGTFLYPFELPGISCPSFRSLPDYSHVDRIVLSVIVTTYNRAPILEYALRSIILQDFPKDMYEIIIMDDASDIGDQDVIKRFIKENSDYNIHAILLKESKTFNEYGPVNIAIKQSHGVVYVRHQADLMYLHNDYLSGVYRHHLVRDNIHLCGVPCGPLSSHLLRDVDKVLETGNLSSILDLGEIQAFPHQNPCEMGASLLKRYAEKVRGYCEWVVGNTPADIPFMSNLRGHGVKFCVDNTLKIMHLPYSYKRPPSYDQGKENSNTSLGLDVNDWHSTDHPWGEMDVPIESVISEGYRRRVLEPHV